MKKLLSFLIFSILTIHLFAGITVSISVITNNGSPARNMPVVLIENTTKKAVQRTTNSMGKVAFQLNTGKKWSVNIKEMKRCNFIEVPEFGEGESSMLITYDPKHWKRINRTPVNRSHIDFAVIDQERLKKQSIPKPEHSYVLLKVKKLDEKWLQNHPAKLTCYATKTQYQSKTKKDGTVLFEVPNNQDYEIDMEGCNNLSYIDIGERSGFFTKSFTFQPLQISESEKNDTILQEIPNDNPALASTGRSFLKLKVNNFRPDLKDESIYLRMLKTNKVYKAKVRKEGHALFMLPLHRQYMIETRYKKAIDVIDYMDSRVKTISRSEEGFNMEVNQRMKYPENYLPSNPQDYVKLSAEKYTLNSQAQQYFNTFFNKQYPEPEKDEPFGMYLKWATPNINKYSKEAILEIGLRGLSIKRLIKNTKHKKLPLNISFVIDVSGSMAGEERLIGVKRSLKKIIKEFDPEDFISVTIFSNNATTVIPSAMMKNHKLLDEIIDDFRAGGGTNIFDGLKNGYKELEKNRLTNGTNRLVLLTDGYGSTPVEQVVNLCKNQYEKGVECSAIGVGSGFNAALLSQLATVSGGLMHYVGQSNRLDNTFVKEFFSATIAIADDACIDIFYKDQLIFKQLYGHNAHAENGRATTDPVQLFPGINKLMVAKFDLINPTPDVEKSPVKVVLQYRDLSTGKIKRIEQKVKLKWKEATGELEYQMERTEKKIKAIAIINQALKVMADQHSAGNSLKAHQTLISTKKQIENLFPNATNNELDELCGVLKSYILTFNYLFANQKAP